MTRLMFCALLIAAACGGSKHEPAPGPGIGDNATGSANATVSGDPTCPLEVPGTSVTVEDTAGGAALVFVTTGDAAAVRTRAQAMASMHTKHDGPDSAMGMMFRAAWTASAKDIEGGARVEFAAAKPDEAGALQTELRMHASHLTSGTCVM